MLNTHYPTNTDIKPTEYPEKQISLADINRADIPWITEDLISTAFNSFKSKKSPGTDELKPIVLKHLNTDYIKFLKSYYKAMIMTRFTPTKWKEAKLVFIPKPGKTAYNIPKA